MRLLLVRHGETDHNRLGVMQGQMQTRLSEAGRRQAQILADVLSREKIDAIYSSTLLRAIETAEAIAARHPHLKVQTAPELNERCYGVLEGMPIAEMRRRWPDEFEEGLEWEIFSRPEKGEHYWDVQNRAVPFILSLARKHSNQTIVVVSHGDTNRVILASLLGLKGADKYTVKQSNICINEILFEGDQIRVRRMNDTSHLQHALEVQLKKGEQK
ncbi:MAG: histidine phosphatase family protein [Candidatus Micrarchaeia archaeon]